MAEPTPAHIMQVGLGYQAAKVLQSGIELNLFTTLAHGAMTARSIADKLGLHPRAIPDFPDALVALGVLEREGDGPGAIYANTPETARFLDRSSPDYAGGILEMANDRGYRFWADLTDALKTGAPQNETKHSDAPMFETLYADPARLEQFMSAMAGASGERFKVFVNTFDFSKYKTLCDVGGATAQLSRFVATAHPHMHCTSFDLPEVAPIAERYIETAGLQDRIVTATGDFFADPLPRADIITMGMILHDWNLEKKKRLIAKAYDALPEGGAFIAIEALIDDARRENAAGLLMSLNMLIEFGDAFDFTGADFIGWCREAGFRDFETLPLAGPASAAVAYK